MTPLRLTAAASAADPRIDKKTLGSGTKTIIISDKEMEGIMKTVKSLEESGLLVKGISETIEKEGKVQKDGFLSVLIGTLSAISLASLLLGKGMIRAGDRVIRARQYF